MTYNGNVGTPMTWIVVGQVVVFLSARLSMEYPLSVGTYLANLSLSNPYLNLFNSNIIILSFR